MTMRHLLIPITLAGAVFVLCAGCALTSKSPPVEFRYFTTESVSAPHAASGPDTGVAGHANRHLQVRIGHVNAASYLRDKIAFRDEGHEVGYYEELRWTEKPEAYLRRAIARVLFEDRGLAELVNKPGATLEVELAAFEELRSPRHVARVEVTWSLRDEQSVQVQRTVAAERPIARVKADELPDVIAAAMAAALGDAVTAIADGAVTELSQEEAGQHR